MYRVSPFVRHFANALVIGVIAATAWVNLSAASYYDFIEWRLADLPLPLWLSPAPTSLTPLIFVSDGLMALFMFFVGKELWEALVLERGALSGPQSIVPLGGVMGAVTSCRVCHFSTLTADEKSPRPQVALRSAGSSLCVPPARVLDATTGLLVEKSRQ